MPKPDLLIVGGSARAAAWCAVRAGLKVAGLDRYNDLDLLAVAAPCFQWDGSDRQVEEVVGALGVPWMYVGPLENRPDLVDRCAKLAPLRGNGGEVLRAVRDPVRVQRVLAEAGLPTLAVREEDDPPPADGRWMVKPDAGCGGRAVAVWDIAAAAAGPPPEPHHFQERAAGEPVAVAAVAGPDRLGGGTLWGQQPSPWPGCVRYGGAVGPLPQNRRLRYAVRRTVERVAEAFGLAGPFGIDAIFDRPRGGPRLRVVEVNPRFSVSHGLEALAVPNAGRLDGDGRFLGTDWFGDLRPPWRRTVGARIVYADGWRRTPPLPPPNFLTPAGSRGPVPYPFPSVADVPVPGRLCQPGEPVCTVLASGADPACVTTRLTVRAAGVKAGLAPAAPPADAAGHEQPA